MENLARSLEIHQEEIKNRAYFEPQKIEERISSVLNHIYDDVKQLNETYLEDTKVEAGGE